MSEITLTISRTLPTDEPLSAHLALYQELNKARAHLEHVLFGLVVDAVHHDLPCPELVKDTYLKADAEAQGIPTIQAKTMIACAMCRLPDADKEGEAPK